ncbi:MAG TPA: hypothetical protein VMJ65_25595 [Solirubrobacteraceae bacterium]|nr:hypothetical protein [Solirubrobacteraceae bacterium]
MEVGGTNRALVIGAHGVLGALTVRAFEGAGWEVRSGARRPRPGEVEIDLGRRDSVAAAVDEHELVVNTVPHPELLAERHVLEHGGVLINVSDLPAAAGRSLRAVAGGARGTVVMNAGLAPGVTTIVAADLLSRHPSAGELEIVFTLSLTVPRGPASADFIYRGLTALARHRTAVVPLPRPFGERRCLGFGEGDAGWLGGIAEGRIVRQYVCIAEPAVHQQLLELNGLGAMTNLPRSLIGSSKQRVNPTASSEPVAHWIAAIRAGRRLSVRTVECLGDFRGAARSTVVFADALRAHPAARGCFDPEEIWTLTGVEANLRAAGITVASPAAPS